MNSTIRIVFIITLIFSFISCDTTKKAIEDTPPSSPQVAAQFEKLTYDNFDQLMKQESGLKLAYFWATWCGPCRTIAPALDNIARDYEGRLTIGKLDVDAEKVIADLHGVRSIPAFLFFKNGELVFQTSGLVTEQYLINVIERLL